MFGGFSCRLPKIRLLTRSLLTDQVIGANDYIYVQPSSSSTVDQAKTIAEELGVTYVPPNQPLPKADQYSVLQVLLPRVQLCHFYKKKNHLGLFSMQPLSPYYTNFANFESGGKPLERRDPLLRALTSSGVSIHSPTQLGQENDDNRLDLQGKTIIDGTAGLGADSFAFARAGAHVTLIEHNPIAHFLLKDGFERARQQNDPQIMEVLQRMTLVPKPMDCEAYFDEIAANTCSVRPDIIYLDPLVHLKKKIQQHKKGQARLILPRSITGSPNREKQVEMTKKAREIATNRVVLKLPFYADVNKANFQYKSRSYRCETYLSNSSTK